MGYKTIIPATPGWFFVQTKKQAEEHKQSHQAVQAIVRVAVWAITDDGAVVGLHGFQGLDFQGGPTQLVAYPNEVKGTFKHIDDFSAEDRASWVALTEARQKDKSSLDRIL